MKSQAREDTRGEVRIFWQQITSDLHTYGQSEHNIVAMVKSEHVVSGGGGD